MGDADETYDFGTIPEFVRDARERADMVLWHTAQGPHPAGAMPWTHRWIGNPLITGMINLMFHAKVSDAYCGLRAIRRTLCRVSTLRSPAWSSRSRWS